MKTVWMIGHSNLPIDRFVGLLNQHEIKTLIDVRSSPYSRFNPWFNTAPLRSSLLSSGIDYMHCPRLGGKPQLASDVVRDLLEQLLPFPSPAAMMCSEGDFRKCHRHYHLAPILRSLQYEVLQIGKDGSTVVDVGDGPEQARQIEKQAGNF